MLVDFAIGQLSRHPNSVLDRVRIRTAVSDDADAFDAQKRSAAVLGLIQPLLEFVKSRAREHVSNFARDGGFQRIAQHLINHVYQALAHLQRNIADEPVTDDYVGFTSENIAALDISDEVDG
jgi:hypothetical protein